MAYDRKLPYNDLLALPPNFDFNRPEILKNLVKASRNLGELKGLCATLPDPNLLINTIVGGASNVMLSLTFKFLFEIKTYEFILEMKRFKVKFKKLKNYQPYI